MWSSYTRWWLLTLYMCFRNVTAGNILALPLHNTPLSVLFTHRPLHPSAPGTKISGWVEKALTTSLVAALGSMLHKACTTPYNCCMLLKGGGGVASVLLLSCS